MMATPEDFKRIVERHKRFAWGSTYVPSTLANRQEAPRIARISRLNSRRLGRTLHALSTPERVYIQLALHHPNLVDLHEQRMLSPSPTVHPLLGHPLTRGSLQRPLRGTVEIAAEIGLRHHEVTIETSDGSRLRLPFPYQGDLLLYLMDSNGIPYALNWTIKDRASAFRERRDGRAKTLAQQQKDKNHAKLRTQLERDYYASAGIRTVQLALEELDPPVHANLEMLFAMHSLPLTHELSLLEDFSSEVAQVASQGAAVAPVAIQYGARWGSRDQFLARIYQDIWDRRLHVNLHRPLLIDQPLDMDGGDILHTYAGIFQEHGE